MVTLLNFDELLTRGFDTALVYSWQTDKAGDFQASLIHTYIDRYEFTSTVYEWEIGVNYAGKYFDFAVPRNRANLNLSWNRGRHGAAANIHYAGHYQHWSNEYEDGEETDEPMIISSQATLDLKYRYEFRGLRQATLRIGCTNCTGEIPPFSYSMAAEPFQDSRGRFYYLRWQQPLF